MDTRILMSILVIGVVAMAAGAGTFAYFSDTETSEGNTFTAGTLNLKVGDVDSTTEKINIPNLKPDDSGNAADWTVQNTGSITGDLSISIPSITNNENTITEPEQDAGDTSNTGELGSYLKVSIWLDMDQDGAWSEGDIALKSDGSTVTNEGSTEKPYDYLDNYGGDSWNDVVTMGSNAAFDFMVDYDFPPANNDDTTQSDSAVFNITFSLEQTTTTG